MIKEKHLTPGRVLLRLSDHPRWREPAFQDEQGDPLAVWIPCMVIAFLPDIKRRHSRATAPRDGWEVLVLWMDDLTIPLEQVRIRPDHRGWKIAGW